MATTKVTNRVLEVDSVGTAQLSAGAVTTKLGSEVGSFAFRNKIINGNFDIWQRNTTFSSVGEWGYTADRWRREGSQGTVNVTQQNFTLGQTEVPNNPRFYLRFNVAAAGALRIAQPIENVRVLSNKTVTYSFWARSSTNTTLTPSFSQFFGTGGTPSSLVITTGTQINLTTTWTKFIGNITLPSISGKVLGSDDNSHTNFRLDPTTTFTGNIDIAQVQVEEGSYATPFEQRPIGTELALCQRYYCIVRWDAQTPAAGATVTTIRYPVTMRTVPTDSLVLAGASGGTVTSTVDAAGIDAAAPRTANGTYGQITTSTNGAFRTGRTIGFDAEL